MKYKHDVKTTTVSASTCWNAIFSTCATCQLHGLNRSYQPNGSNEIDMAGQGRDGYDSYAGGPKSYNEYDTYESYDEVNQTAGMSVDGYVLDAQGRIIVGKAQSEEYEVESVNVFISQWKNARRAAEMDGPMVRN